MTRHAIDSLLGALTGYSVLRFTLYDTFSSHIDMVMKFIPVALCVALSWLWLLG